MKKNIAKIKAFFKRRNNTEVNIKDMDRAFVLSEGGLFDTAVNTLHSWGVETDGQGEKNWDELEATDLKYIAIMLPELEKQLLIDDVIEAIKNDIIDGDLSALDELLKFIPEKNLKAYLPERAIFK